MATRAEPKDETTTRNTAWLGQFYPNKLLLMQQTQIITEIRTSLNRLEESIKKLQEAQRSGRRP